MLDNLERIYLAIYRFMIWLRYLAGALLFVEALLITLYALQRYASVAIIPLSMSKQYELQWHIHTIIFSLTLGLCYLQDSHVRIDVVTASRSERTRAILELTGIFLFAIPFICTLIWFSWDFALASFVSGESSDSPSGLPYRWVLKFILMLGFVLLLVSIFAVGLRSYATIKRSRNQNAGVVK